MITSLVLTSVMLTTQWMRPGFIGWESRTPYLDSTWDEYDSTTPFVPVEIPSDIPLVVWLRENVSAQILVSKEERALAEGVVIEIFAKKRIPEATLILQNSSDYDGQMRMFSILASYFYRTQDAQEFNDGFLAIFAKSAVEGAIKNSNSDLFNELFQRVGYKPAQALLDEMTTRLFHSEPPLTIDQKKILLIGGQGIDRWTSKTYPQIFGRFLSEVSLPLMIDDLELWNQRVQPSLHRVVRTQATNAESAGPNFKEAYYQVTYLRPAIANPEGEEWIKKFYKNDFTPQQEAAFLIFASQSSEHRLRILSEELIRRSRDETFDEILSRCPADLKDCGIVFEIFFNRDQLSPGSRLLIINWMKTPRGKPLGRVFDQLGRWGDSALPLLPNLTSFYSAEASSDQKEGIAALVAGRDLGAIFQSIPLDQKQQVRLLDDLAYAKETPLNSLTAHSIWRLLDEPNGLYNNDKDRDLTAALLNYFAQRTKEASDLELETLMPIVKQMFALPPDTKTDHPLLIILRAMKDRLKPLPNEVEKMLHEMK